jgi:hypothetical protein
MAEDVFEQYGIKTDAPRKVKILCLEIKRLQKLYSDWERALGAIDWWKDPNASVKSKQIWLRMNFIERQMTDTRGYIFMAWQNREPADVVGEIERGLFGTNVPPQSTTSPKNSILSQQP